MSEHLSFREKLDRRAAAKASVPDPSISPVLTRIEYVDSLSQPVTFARLLTQNGLTLSQAHRALGELVNEHAVIVTLRPHDKTELFSEIRALSLRVFELETAEAGAKSA